jgi:hypothetical protein
VQYLPTLRLFFDGGRVFNDYRLNHGHIEFHTRQGEWRVLDNAKVQLHYSLHTEVAHWLIAHMVELNPYLPKTDQKL